MEDGATLDPANPRERGESMPAKNAPLLNVQATTISTPMPGMHESGVDTSPRGEEIESPCSAEPELSTPGGGSDGTTLPGMLPDALPDTLAGWISLTHPELLPLAVAPALVALLALWVGGARLNVPLALLTLVALSCLWAGASVLISARDALLARLSSSLLPGLPAALIERAGIQVHTATFGGLSLVILGAICGFPVALVGGPAVGSISIAALVCLGLYVRYTGAVRAAAVGEVLMAVVFGPLLGMAVALSQIHRVPPMVWLFGGALGALVLAVALATDLRDAPQHQAEGRRTLVTYLGERGSALACVLCVVASFALIALAALPLRTPHGALLVGLALPAALIAASSVLLARPGVPRQFAAREVLRLYSLVALWLAVGLLADGIVRRILAALQVG